MPRLLFFCRVAFICNICFVLAWFMQYLPGSEQGHISATILVLGIGVAVLVNIVVLLSFLLMWLRKKSWPEGFPRWLIIANFLFLLLQLITILR